MVVESREATPGVVIARTSRNLGRQEPPSEAEWEFAARGGLETAVFTWGDEHFPDGNAMANTWQGEFPWQNLKVDAAASEPGSHIPRKVIKGGSHLCAPNYCLRHRPAARQPEMIDSFAALPASRKTSGGEG